MSEHSIRTKISPLTVLLIDSNKEDRQCWTRRIAMESPEAVVLEADTDEAALAICRSQRIDCVIFEPDVANLVPRAHDPNIPIIVLTGRALYPMGELALKNGAQAYLVKAQISGDILTKALQEAMARVSSSDCRFGRGESNESIL